jgi:flagellin
MIDTAEGAHDEISNILQRMRELAVQSANDTNNDTDRGYLQAEVNALVTEIDRIANVTTWAGKGLIDSQHTYSFQVGSKGASDNQIAVTMNAMTGAALGVKAGNAAVGVNGATMAEVGESTIQFGGTAAVGDIYTLKVHGEDVQLKIAADAGATFTYQFKSTNHNAGNGVGEWSNASNLGTTSGKTTNDVATAMKAAIDLIGAGEVLGDITATVNADDTLTIQNPINLADNTSTVDGSTITTSLVTTNANDYSLTIAADTDANYVTAAKITINNVTFDATNTATTDAYEDSTAGTAKKLEDLITAAQAAGKLAGLTFTVTSGDFDAGTASNDIKVRVQSSATGLASDAAATAGLSTNALLINTASDANAAIATIDTALDTVNSQRAQLGAVSNRLKSTVSNLTNISVNLEAGRSRIQDADFATETSNLTKTQILSQAATAMLAQANASKQSVLSLLQG